MGIDAEGYTILIKCDACPGWSERGARVWEETIYGETKAIAYANARAAGWRIGKRVTCPACAKGEAQDG